MSARRIVFTKNNWTPEEKAALLSECKFSYVVVGEEVGSQGTPHLQGYAEFVGKTRWAPIAKKYSMHCELARTQAEAIAYCKKDGLFEERGTPRLEGGLAEKARWRNIISLAEQGDLDTIKLEEPAVYLRCYSTLLKIKQSMMPALPELDSLDNIWLWGPPGIGKSRTARDSANNFYPKPLNKWWDGYLGQDTVIIDDWEKDCHLGHYLKIWADRYDFIGETKGGSVRIRPRHIFVTSNYSPDACFTGEELVAIRRRFRVIKMDSL